MRAKQLCFGAALAAMAVLLGCHVEFNNPSASSSESGGTGTTVSGTVGPNGNCTITMTRSSLSKALSAGRLLLSVGETATASDAVTANPAGCASLAHHFASSDTTVATVDQSGNITGKKIGTTNICDFVDANLSIFICIPTDVSGGTGAVVATGIVVVPNPDTYVVGTVKTPTDTVKYSDGSVKVNQVGSFTCSSANVGIVLIVNTSTCQEQGIAVGVVNVTFCATGTTVCTVQVVTVTTGNLVTVTPTATAVSSGALCSVFTLQFTATTIPSGLAITWTKTSHVTGATLSATGLYTFASGLSGVDTVTATAAGGGSGFGVVTVTNAACSGPVDFIDYTPPGGNVPVGSSLSTPTATCTLASGAVCDKEFWSSNHPECKDVNATDGVATVNGFSFPVGPHAKIVSIASCTANISVQASITNPTLKRTYAWTGS